MSGSDAYQARWTNHHYRHPAAQDESPKIPESLDRDDLKEMLSSLIGRIGFDFSELECCIHYKIPVKRRDLVASPTRFELVLSP